jgi:hypothetical protein
LGKGETVELAEIGRIVELTPIHRVLKFETRNSNLETNSKSEFKRIDFRIANEFVRAPSCAADRTPLGSNFCLQLLYQPLSAFIGAERTKVRNSALGLVHISHLPDCLAIKECQVSLSAFNA